MFNKDAKCGSVEEALILSYFFFLKNTIVNHFTVCSQSIKLNSPVVLKFSILMKTSIYNN